MDNSSILSKLHEVFADVFNRDDIILSRETSAKDIKNWDSVTHVILVSSVEKTFKIRFSSREVAGFKTVGDMIDAIEKKSGV